MVRMLGKLPAVHDPRMARLKDILITAPNTSAMNWRADLPDSGIPMLGNDVAGCCVFATAFHYIQLAAIYALKPLPQEPTADECLMPYSAVTGYDPTQTQPDGSNPTDKGTVVMGPGGLVEYWIKTGLVCGGVRNMLTSAATVDIHNPDELQAALKLGPVLMGSSLTQANVDADFMWTYGQPFIGGHETLLTGCEIISSGKAYYDIVTWDGERRADDDFMARSADEAVVVLDDIFFDARGYDPAGIDKVALAAAINQIRMA